MRTNIWQFTKNNIYATKTIWHLSKSRVVHAAVSSAIGYFEWLFASVFFMRFIIGAIENRQDFMYIAMFLVIATFVIGACSLYVNYVEWVVSPITGNIIRRDLYAKLYAKARNVELYCYEDADFYNRYTMALDNSDGKVITATHNFFQIVFGVVASGVAFYVMYTIDPFSVLFVISPILGNFFLGSIAGKLAGKQFEENTPHNRKIGYVGRVLYLAEFAKEVRMSKIFNLMKSRYFDGVKGNQKVATKFGKKATAALALRNIFTFAFVFEGIMLYAAFRAIVSRTMGLAELAIMFSAMVTTSWIFIGLFENISQSLTNGVFIGYIKEFMDYKEKIPEDTDGLIPAESITSIEFINVSFAYKDEHTAIKNCTFTIQGGQTVAFAGHNGAGKSTLIKLLFRLYDPTEGKILVNGINIKEYNLKLYRSLFAAAFQDYKIFSLSVLDNVLLESKEGEETAKKALKQAGVWDEIKALANGINTTLTKEFDENGTVLSEGNNQKVIVARAFAKNAPIQVYDEPSSALDPIAEYKLYTSIMKASRGHTTLFISHRLSSVADADIVFVMENGTIIERGSHAELMAQKGEYSKMYIMQAESYLAEEVAI